MSLLHLRHLVLALTLTGIVLTLANSLIASYRVQRDLLLQASLEANRVYAMKLASATDLLLRDLILQLRYSAQVLVAQSGGRQPDDAAQLQAEADRLTHQAGAFNGVHIVDPSGQVLAAAPREEFRGMVLESSGSQEALQARAPYISSLYRAQTGRRVMVVSVPLLSADGTFHGYIGGTLYPDESNVLHELLGQHFYQDGSYIYVVDGSGQLVYHIEPGRVGEVVRDNLAVQAVMSGQSGSQRVVNLQGVDMLVGYAPISMAGWGVLAQQPTDRVLAQQRRLLGQNVLYVLPLLGLSLVGVWLVSTWIARPLSQLANYSRRMHEVEEAKRELAGVNAWYQEAAQLKLSLLASLGQIDDKLQALRLDSHTDPLTGLINRRGMVEQANRWIAAGRRFAVLVLDIDHFKAVNDTYGHDVGDEVLRRLAVLMRQNARELDVLCRSGGEEFAVFLPDADWEVARQIAERLRLRVERSEFPVHGRVTISIGVACHPDAGTSLEQVLKAADVAMYQAKTGGRNRVVLGRGLPLIEA